MSQPQLVVREFNGKRSYSIEMFPAPSIQPKLEVVLARVTLAENMLGLTLDQLITLYEAGKL